MSETDPVTPMFERLRGYATVALTVAARIAEVAAHRRAEQMRQAQRLGEQYVRQAQEQQRAEIAATRHQLREVGSKAWWDKSGIEEVAAAYATARAYGRIDPELYGTAAFMGQEIRDRYGVDADRLVDEAERGVGYSARIDAFDHPIAGPTAEATARYDELGRKAAAEQGEAAALLAEANMVDTAVHRDGVVDAHEATHDVPFAQTGWDDAARREGLAARLEAALPDAPDAVQARLVTDRLQGRPAAAAPAAAQSARRAPKARNVPVKGAERTIGR